jgi:chaperonin GroEL (HSP60 family)
VSSLCGYGVVLQVAGRTNESAGDGTTTCIWCCGLTTYICLVFVLVFLLQVAGRTNDSAGDGTTTASVLAREMIHFGLQVRTCTKAAAAAANAAVSAMRRCSTQGQQRSATAEALQQGGSIASLQHCISEAAAT